VKNTAYNEDTIFYKEKKMDKLRNIKIDKEKVVVFTKGFIKGVLIAGAVVGVYYLVTNLNGEDESENVPEISQE